MNEAERQQIDLFLDGALSDAEAEELFSRLEEDPQFAAYLAERAELHSDLRRSLKRRKLQLLAVAESVEESRRHRGTALPARWVSRGVAVAASVGMMVGIATTSLVWAFASPTPRVQVRSLFHEGFEDAGLTLSPKFPDVSGIWSINLGVIKPTETAAEGRNVVRFGPAPRRPFSYLNHIVDVSALGSSSGIERKALRLRLMVRPAEAPVSVQRYKVRLASFAADPAAVKEQWFSGGDIGDRALTFASSEREGSQSDWIRLEASLPLPAEARHVVISVGAASIGEDPTKIAYEADDVQLDLVTLPGTGLGE